MSCLVFLKWVTFNCSNLLCVRFPLYLKGKEKFQFHYGVFLLNKNIAQVFHSSPLTAITILILCLDIFSYRDTVWPWIHKAAWFLALLGIHGHTLNYNLKWANIKIKCILNSFQKLICSGISAQCGFSLAIKTNISGFNPLTPYQNFHSISCLRITSLFLVDG